MRLYQFEFSNRLGSLIGAWVLKGMNTVLEVQSLNLLELLFKDFLITSLVHAKWLVKICFELYLLIDFQKILRIFLWKIVGSLANIFTFQKSLYK